MALTTDELVSAIKGLRAARVAVLAGKKAEAKALVDAAEERLVAEVRLRVANEARAAAYQPADVRRVVRDMRAALRKQLEAAEVLGDAETVAAITVSLEALPAPPDEPTNGPPITPTEGAP